MKNNKFKIKNIHFNISLSKLSLIFFCISLAFYLLAGVINGIRVVSLSLALSCLFFAIYYYFVDSFIELKYYNKRVYDLKKDDIEALKQSCATTKEYMDALKEYKKEFHNPYKRKIIILSLKTFFLLFIILYLIYIFVCFAIQLF